MAIVEIKSGGAYSGEYSGASTIKYYARNLCRLFTFSMFVSGASQVQTFLAKIYVKVSGYAISSSLRNMIVTTLIKEKSNKWTGSNTKNSLASISLKFNLNGRIENIKKLASSVNFNLLLSDAISVTKIISSYFSARVSGEADITVAKYIPLTDFTSNTLDDLLANALEDMIYT
jgi:hypothetical protein